MARTYTTVGWQDGEVLEPAKVTVAGTEYEVEPEVISGRTPVNASNLRKMDNEIKTIVEEDIPSVLNVRLLAVDDIEPTECSTGDKYFNKTTNLIYTATGTNTWDTNGETPIVGILYVVFDEQTTYAYDGTTLISVGGGTDNSGGETLKIGCILPFSGTNAPDGYLLCDGSAVSRTTYADLFNEIGVTYGAGDGSTTFNLPNLKGKVPVGLDSDDEDFASIGTTGGEKEHTLTIEEMPSHRHSWSLGANVVANATSHTAVTNYNSTGGGLGVATMNSTGGNQSHNNLQPYLVVNYIIKAMNTTPIQAQIMSSYSTSVSDGYSCDYINNQLIVSDINASLGTIQKSANLWDQTVQVTIPSGYEPLGIVGYSLTGEYFSWLVFSTMFLNGNTFGYTITNRNDFNDAKNIICTLKVLLKKIN